jgi:hypothetical protein
MLKFSLKTFVNFSKGLQRMKILKIEKKQSFNGPSQRSTKKTCGLTFVKVHDSWQVGARVGEWGYM